MESTKGEIIFDGQNVTNWWPEKLRKAGLGIIPEDRYAQGLCREMSVSEIVLQDITGQKISVSEDCTIGKKSMRREILLLKNLISVWEM